MVCTKWAASFVLVVLGVCQGQGLDDLWRLQEGRTMRSSSTAEDWRNSNVDFRPILPGKSHVLADLEGPGTIKRIWMTVLPSEPGYPSLMTIRIYWDGEKNPSVEAPIGDFFGVGHGMDSGFDSLPVRSVAGGRSRSCVWPMPFRKSARVEVANEGSEATWGFYYMVDWEKGPVARDAAYFHASYRQTFPTRPGADHLVADVSGRGHYVGTVLSVRANSGGWWGEGDDFFTVDGEREPRLKGTGMEDYFLQAWGVHRESGHYSGCSVLEGSRATMYRWHVPDPVRFRRSLRMDFEHKGVEFGKEGNNNERADDFSSVAFWYQAEPHKPFPSLPPAFERLPFDFRTMVQGESLVESVKATGGDVNVQKANGLSKGQQLEWVATAAGQELSVPFTVDREDEYEILLLLTRRWDAGKVESFVDEAQAGTFDLHHWGFTPYFEAVLPYRKLSAGEHRIRFRSTAPNWLGLDGIVVHRRRR
ncbi:MAG TPA: glycoside hydrolase family 172 protein [Fimbriimonas sp.]